jgi:hypothetical protein
MNDSPHHRLTGCPRGCLTPAACTDCGSTPSRTGGHCCGTLGVEQLAAATRLALTCSATRCAANDLQDLGCPR